MKNLKVKLYMGAVFLTGIAVLIYATSGKSIQTTSQIPLNYFKSPQELADSIQNLLQQQLTKETYFWFGVEPGFGQQLETLKLLKQNIEKQNGPFDLVYVDQELQLTMDQKNLFGPAKVAEVKDGWGHLAKEIKQNLGKRILVITAAIYSTNLLRHNPLDKINEFTEYKPMTFSVGYFPVIREEEKKNIFPCETDNKEGTVDWGCAIANKARSQRRKIDLVKIQPPNSLIPGLMDSTGEKDYMILVR